MGYIDSLGASWTLPFQTQRLCSFGFAGIGCEDARVHWYPLPQAGCLPADPSDMGASCVENRSGKRTLQAGTSQPRFGFSTGFPHSTCPTVPVFNAKKSVENSRFSDSLQVQPIRQKC